MYRNPGFWRIVIVLLLSACGGGGGGGGGGMGIPGAMLTSISPSRVPAGSPTFTLTINGSGFVAGGTVSWNGSGLGPYTLVSSTQVTIQVPAADVTTAGTMGSIVVSIPTPKTNPSNALAFTVSAFTSSACMLFGPYDFVFTGFDASGPVTIGGNFGVDAGGNVTGEDDFKNTTATRAAEAITGGSCKNDPAIANQGTLTLTTAAGTSTYSFVTQASAPGGKGRLAATSGPNGLLGSGRFAFAPPSGFFSGDYAFAMTGGDGSGGQMSLAGRFTDSNNNQFNTPGTLSGGVGDINDAGAVSAGVAITGTVGVPDAFGRSAATFHLGPNTTFQIAFYVLSSSGGFAVDVDSGAGTPVLGGLVSVQANPGLYSNGYLAAPVVLSTWGTAAGPPATSVTSVGLLTPGIGPASGTFTLVLDQMISGAPNLNQSLAGGSRRELFHRRQRAGNDVLQVRCNHLQLRAVPGQLQRRLHRGRIGPHGRFRLLRGAGELGAGQRHARGRDVVSAGVGFPEYDRATSVQQRRHHGHLFRRGSHRELPGDGGPGHGHVESTGLRQSRRGLLRHRRRKRGDHGQRQRNDR